MIDSTSHAIWVSPPVRFWDSSSSQDKESALKSPVSVQLRSNEASKYEISVYGSVGSPGLTSTCMRAWISTSQTESSMAIPQEIASVSDEDVHVSKS